MWAHTIEEILKPVAKIDVKKVFGASVRGRRTQLGISQEQLAERASLHRTYVSDVERGSRNVSLKNIERLALALEVSVAALFPQATLESTPARPLDRLHPGKNLVEVLLVEDNPDDVELTLRAFKQARFTNRVQVVTDGEAALDYVLRRGKYARARALEAPQLILLDLNLPKLSGLEVLRRLKAEKHLKSIPVVILTVSQGDYDMAECRRLGAENYIVKPVNFQRLSQATPRLHLDWALCRGVQA